MSTQETKPEPRRPKLRLPFDNRREDAGEWAYDHRIGLCITLIAYLVLMIALYFIPPRFPRGLATTSTPSKTEGNVMVS